MLLRYNHTSVIVILTQQRKGKTMTLNYINLDFQVSDYASPKDEPIVLLEVESIELS